MRVFGLAGWSGSGKTTLMTRLLPALLQRGVSVSTIKHAHHAFDVDQPGKDSYRHREAGATEVMVSSERRWALMHELRGAAEPPLEQLLRHMSPVDLVIVEGFKRAAVPKLEVYRAAVGKPLLAPEDSDIVADRFRLADRRAHDDRCRCRVSRSTMSARSPSLSSLIFASPCRAVAQLSDDCFAFGGELMSSAAALALLKEKLSPVTEAERVR